MNPRYPLYHRQSARPSEPSDQTASRWWRPLTNGWGIFGVIIFIGLVMRLIGGLGHWRVRQPVSLPSEQATTVPAAQPDQSSVRSRPEAAGAHPR
jgi:hypothetical protein